MSIPSCTVTPATIHPTLKYQSDHNEHKWWNESYLTMEFFLGEDQHENDAWYKHSTKVRSSLRRIVTPSKPKRQQASSIRQAFYRTFHRMHW